MSCSPILDCQLTAIGTVLAAQLTDTCTIKRAVLADDGRGGRTRTLTDLATGVACLVVKPRWRASETNVADKLTGKTTWNIYLPPGQDVKAATDQIVVTSLGNRTFEVDGMVSASIEILRAVQATEIDPA